MSATWMAVDAYLEGVLHGESSDLDRALAVCEAAGLPGIQVTPTLGKLLHLLVRIHGARRVLEIGTLGGYSTIWLARALPDEGQVVTIELDPKHTQVAAANFAASDLAGQIDLRAGDALDVLPQLEAEGQAPFDFIFIDADKTQNVAYLQWALKLSRSGTLIVLDNVVRAGAIADAASDDPFVQGSREGLAWLGRHPRIDATAIQTVGAKGYDGFAIALIK